MRNGAHSVVECAPWGHTMNFAIESGRGLAIMVGLRCGSVRKTFKNLKSLLALADHTARNAVTSSSFSIVAASTRGLFLLCLSMFTGEVSQ